jgi:hypothetical protein
MTSDISNNAKTRILRIESGEVQCLPEKRESVDKCRFCVHSKRFREAGVWKVSPARAYCTLCKNTDKVNFDIADAVECDDMKNEGYRSILNVIS